MPYTRYLELNVDVAAGSAGQLVSSKTSLSPVGAIVVIQNDYYKVRVRYLERGASDIVQPTAMALEPGAQIILAARLADDLESGDLLFSATGFVETIQGDDVFYEGTLDLTPDALEAAVIAAGAGGLLVLCDLKLQNAPNTERVTLPQFQMTVRREVYRGTEGVPLTGDPVYPAPGALLTVGEDSATIKRGSENVAVASGEFEVVFGTPFPSAARPSQVLVTLGVPAGLPGMLAWIAETTVSATGFTVQLGAPAPDAGYVLHWVALA